jgi:predicted SprT family Zn-dependent metalloprotease
VVQARKASEYWATKGKTKHIEEVVAHELGHAMGMIYNRAGRYAIDGADSRDFNSYFACTEQKKAHMLMYGSDVAEGERTWAGCSHWGS